MSPKHISALTALLLFRESADSAAEEGPVVDWGCSDIVAIGRVKTVAYTDMSGDEDLLVTAASTRRFR